MKKEKLLEMQLNHIYKDVKNIFKKNHYKYDEVSIDNLKEELQSFISFIKTANLHANIKYNSFEDIKEQSNDDSAHSRSQIAGQRV